MGTITEAEREKYSPYLLDWLCRIYKYVDKFKDNQTTHKVIDFSEHGIRMAIRNLSYNGQCDQKFLDKFVSNLDVMKDIAEKQPKHEVIYSVIYIDENGKEVYRKESEILEAYDKSNLIFKPLGLTRKLLSVKQIT